MFKVVALAAVAALGLSSGAEANAAGAKKVYDGPSQPKPGQMARYRAAPRDGYLSIVPPDGAEFLKGQYFDARIELHNECAEGSKVENCGMPSLAGLACTVNGKDLPSFFGKSWPATPETWNFTFHKDMNASYSKVSTPVGVSSFAFRSLSFPAPGDYDYKCTVPGIFVANSTVARQASTPQTVYGKWHVRSFEDKGRKAKNVVLFIGDGMGPGMVTAARALSEPTWYGKYYNNLLGMEQSDMTHGKVITNGMDSMLTDSANSAASYTTGHKGFVNSLNVNADTSPDTLDDPKIETIAEILRRRRPNTCIGVVTTAEIQDATPAAVFAHTRRRSDKAVITTQNLEQTFKDWVPPPAQVDVLMGGGGAYFCNGTKACKSAKGRDMYAEYAAKGYKLVTTTDDLEKFSGNDKLLGIFALNNLDTWIDRVLLTENLARTNSSPLGEPAPNVKQAGLELMVKKAIETMDKRCSDGWFLMAEAASVDKSMHPQDYQRGLADLLEMDRAVKHAKQYGYEHGDNTLVMVTADHSQAYDVYGSVDIEYGKDLPERDPNDDSQFLLKQAIGVYNQAGFFDLVVDPATGKPDRWNGRFVLAQGKVDGPMRRENFSLVEHPESGTNPLTRAPAVEDKNLTQALGSTTFVANPKDGEHGIDVHGLLPGNSESSVHSMADVPLYCHGPAQGACGRTMDNTELFFVIAQAFGL